jgi:hypothetical protein
MGQTDNAVWGDAFGNLRITLLIALYTIAQHLGQQRSCRPHLWMVGLPLRRLHHRLGTLHRRLQLHRSDFGILPVDGAFAVALQVSAQVRCQPAPVPGRHVACRLEHLANAFCG